MRRIDRSAPPLFRNCIALIAFGISGAGSQAQEPTNTVPTLSVRTQLVTLDITVDDKAGNPILDLNKGDFQILENGVPQRVRYFSTPTEHRMPVGKPVTSEGDLSRIGNAPVSLLVLDEINTPFVDMALARSALFRYLAAQPDLLPQPTALLFVSNQKLEIIRDYTQNKADIESALKKHFPDYPWQLTVNNGDMAILPRMSRTFASLVEIAESSRGILGRKNVIWVGKGFPSADLTQTDPDSVKVMSEAVKKTVDALLDSKVSLFTIDPEALDPTPVIDQESDSSVSAGDLNGTGLVFQGALTFSSMADATGGHAFAMNNFIDREIASSISDGANYYEISYSPSTQSDDPLKYRKIKVLVDRPGVSVVSRDGYFPDPATRQQQEAATKDVGQIKFDISTAAMNRIPYDGLRVTAEKSTADVYTVGIGLSGLQWRDSGSTHVAELTIMAVCFSSKDKPLRSSSSEHTASTPGDISHLNGQLTYKLPLEIPSGTTRIRFVVRDVGSSRVGTADVAVP